MAEEKPKKYHCGFRDACKFYPNMSSLYRNQVCNAMAIAQILRGDKCPQVTIGRSKLEKMIKRLDDVSQEIKKTRAAIRKYLPKKQ